MKKLLNMDGTEVTLETLDLKELDGKFLIVRVGTDAHPAGLNDIENAYQLIQDLLKDTTGVRCIVTHHAIDISTVSFIAKAK